MRLNDIHQFTAETLVDDHNLHDNYNYTCKTVDTFQRKCFPKSKSKRTAIKKYSRRRQQQHSFTSNSWMNSIFITFIEHCKLWQRYFAFNYYNNNNNPHNKIENIFSRKSTIREVENGENGEQKMIDITYNSNSNSNSNANQLKAHNIKRTNRIWMKSFPRFSATSLFTLFVLICAETVLLSTMTNCAKTFYMHWNTSNSIFRIDNTDHIIDVNKGNLAFEFDQVHIICPVYEPGTYENETEKYIIYNVSKVEYETCRITNADPRVIAICDKPQKLMFFTITFRPFTPQPGGLEFLPGNDYYFISTSSKDDLYRRIGGRCSTNNMKVVFKVCCAKETRNKTIPITDQQNVIEKNGGAGGASGNGVSNMSNGNNGGDNSDEEFNVSMNVNHVQSSSGHHVNHHVNTIATNDRWNNGGISIANGNGGMIPTSVIRINADTDSNNHNNRRINNNNGGGQRITSINTEVDTFNRLPTHSNSINVLDNSIVGSSNNNNNNIGLGSGGVVGGNGILMHGDHNNNGVHVLSIGDYPSHGYRGQSGGVRINNVPSSHYTNRDHIDDNFDKHSNEVVKNEELTYNSASSKNRFFIIEILWAMCNAGNGVLNSLKEYSATTKSARIIIIEMHHSSSRSLIDLFHRIKNFVTSKSTELVYSINVLKLTTIFLITYTVLLIGLVFIYILWIDSFEINTKIIWYHKKRIKRILLNTSKFRLSSSIDDRVANTTTTTINKNGTINDNDKENGDRDDKNRNRVNVCHYNKWPAKRINIKNIFNNNKRIKLR